MWEPDILRGRALASYDSQVGVRSPGSGISTDVNGVITPLDYLIGLNIPGTPGGIHLPALDRAKFLGAAYRVQLPGVIHFRHQQRRDLLRNARRRRHAGSRPAGSRRAEHVDTTQQFLYAGAPYQRRATLAVGRSATGGPGASHFGGRPRGTVAHRAPQSAARGGPGRQWAASHVRGRWPSAAGDLP